MPEPKPLPSQSSLLKQYLQQYPRRHRRCSGCSRERRQRWRRQRHTQPRPHTPRGGGLSTDMLPPPMRAPCGATAADGEVLADNAAEVLADKAAEQADVAQQGLCTICLEALVSDCPPASVPLLPASEETSVETSVETSLETSEQEKPLEDAGDASAGSDSSCWSDDGVDALCAQQRDCAGLSMPCGHRFHRRCLLRWLESCDSCPLCRTRLEP